MGYSFFTVSFVLPPFSAFVLLLAMFSVHSFQEAPPSPTSKTGILMFTSEGIPQDDLCPDCTISFLGLLV